MIGAVGSPLIKKRSTGVVEVGYLYTCYHPHQSKYMYMYIHVAHCTSTTDFQDWLTSEGGRNLDICSAILLGIKSYLV